MYIVINFYISKCFKAARGAGEGNASTSVLQRTKSLESNRTFKIQKPSLR